MKKTEKNSIFRICPKSFPKVPKSVLGWFYWKVFMPSAPWRVEYSKIFKIFFFKIPKEPKIVPKIIQTCFERVLGRNFRKKFWPVFHGGSRLLNLEKKPKKTQYSEFALNRSQKCPKTFWGHFFEIILCPVLHGGSSFQNFSRKIFSKFQNCPESFPKNSKPVLNVFWGKFFEIFYAQCSMEGRVFENFRKKPKIFNVPKSRKSLPKVSKRVLNVFWGKFFEKLFPSFPWRVESSKIFEKKLKIFKVPEKPKTVTKSVQTCFELVLGQIFPKKILPSVPWARDF